MATLAAPHIERIPPHNLEAEMAVLGSILVDREMMATVSEILAPSDFYAILHETIYAALVQLYERGEPLDKITLAEELKLRGALDKVGGLAYLSSLMETVPTAASAEYYAKIVREKSTLRSLIHAGTNITQLGYEDEEDVDGALDRSEQIVYEIGRRQQRGEFHRITKLLKDAFEQIDRLYHSRGDRTGVTSGFRDIDEYTAGFQPGNFVIIAARPAMGKTSIALAMAAAAAKEEQRPIAVFSLEMTSVEIVTRLLCAEARVNGQHLRRGNVQNDEWDKISDGMGALAEVPIYIDDSGTLTVSEVRSRCRRLQSGEGLSAVFIDYLQLLRPSSASRNQNRNEELSEICRTLKATAKDLEVPIIALAQLNRAVETRNDKRPMLADLRDCLAGESLVTNADTGERIPVAEIVERGVRFNVWAVDDRLKLVRRPITDAWCVGQKPLLRVRTQSGRVIRCTEGHRFLCVSGWRELRELRPGEAIAVPKFRESGRDGPVDFSRVATGVSHSAFGRDQGKAMSRATCALVAERLGDDVLESLAYSDVLWDRIVSIEPLGVEPVYDITVGDLHNFCVNDIVTHNSGAIEQEADLVAFLYRDSYYNPESAPEPDLTEFIIAKQRNGPTGMVKLRFLKEHTLFVPYGDASRFSGP
jgi:replicative DNA helicase